MRASASDDVLFLVCLEGILRCCSVESFSDMTVVLSPY